MFVLVLLVAIQQAQAESFMDSWLAKQVASQLPSSSPFNKDDWLARQKGQGEDDWIARQASAASRADSFSQDDWLARQAESSGEDATFSQEEWAPAASWEADEDLEQSLLADVEAALGKEHRHFMESRIKMIEEKMQPMFQALPKNEYEKLGHSSVRYMLHRFLVAQHGWFIDGLFSEGAALNTSSPSHALKDRVPMFVQGLFEKRLGGRGFGLHELSVLVAVVEDSVHQEGQGNLKKTYDALGLPHDMTLDHAQAAILIDVYMSGFVMNTNMSAISADDLYQQRSNMILFYPSWHRAQKYFDEVRASQFKEQLTVSFAEISAIISKLVDTFGTFHGKQCQGLKNSLQGMERRGSSGCVDLPDFYKAGLNGDSSNFLFIESPEYMRQIGVLDESDPQNPRLLSANYINSPTNCLQPTGYYMVCCHNECDDILGQLERQLAQPGATPAEIVAALRTVASFSAPSLRAGMLTPTLRRRLEEVAEHHGGRVPIHGRLFAQWLHHVYPHECPYPHVSGSKHPQWVEDFETETGKMSQLTTDEMHFFLVNASKKVRPARPADAGSCAPWQNEEELFAPLPRALALHELEDDPHVWNFAGGLAFVAAASTFTISLLRTCKSMTKLKYQPKMLQV